MHSFDHSAWVDAYLSGKLSASERLQFETELFRNETLRDELAFQQDIIEALNETRRMELKARLNNVQVPGQGIWAGGMGSMALKYAAGIVGTLLLAGSLYFVLNEQDDEAIRPLQLSTQTREISAPALPQRPQAESQQLADATQARKLPATEPGSASKTVASEPSIERVTEKVNSTEPKASPKAAEVEKPKPSVPQIQRPEVLTFDEPEKGGQEEENIKPENPLQLADNFKATPLEVSTQKHEWYSFHYRFLDHRLYLYGDFGSEPYEILEILDEKGSSFYLYHQAQYYHLSPDQKKISKLKPIKDRELIHELEVNRQLKK